MTHHCCWKIDSKSSGNKVDMVLNDSSSRSYKWKFEKAVRFRSSNELIETLSFFNQSVPSEKANFFTENDLLAICRQEGRIFHLLLAICLCSCQEQRKPRINRKAWLNLKQMVTQYVLVMVCRIMQNVCNHCSTMKIY